jgi:inner membrane protein
MASLGHLAVGFCTARARRSRLAGWVAWPALALAADLDVIGFRFGVPYAAPFGHRGATHSIAFAALVGLAAGLVARKPRVGLIAFAVALTHPLLDALTDGGLGVALFWPFSNARYFAPWRPIPVAPIGTRLFSSHGFRVMAIELAMFLPLFVVAFWPSRSGTKRP